MQKDKTNNKNWAGSGHHVRVPERPTIMSEGKGEKGGDYSRRGEALDAM